MQAGESRTDDSKSSCTKRHLRTSFVPIGILTKNNLSSKRIKVTVSASGEGIAGMLVLGAAGGGPGKMSGNPCSNAEEVPVGNVGATSDTSSAARHNFVSGSESQN